MKVIFKRQCNSFLVILCSWCLSSLCMFSFQDLWNCLSNLCRNEWEVSSSSIWFWLWVRSFTQDQSLFLIIYKVPIILLPPKKIVKLNITFLRWKSLFFFNKLYSKGKNYNYLKEDFTRKRHFNNGNFDFDSDLKYCFAFLST